MSPEDADGMTNSVDSDKTALEEQSDLGLHYFLGPVCPHTCTYMFAVITIAQCV